MRKLSSFGDHFDSQIIFYALRRFTIGKRHQFINKDIFKSVHLFFIFFVELGKHSGFGAFSFAFLHSFGEECRTDNYTFERRRSFERCIFYIACLIAEDGTKEFFLGRRIGLSFRSDFTDHDIARFHMSSDTNDTPFIEVFGSIFADIGDIGSKFLHTAFGFTHFK